MSVALSTRSKRGGRRRAAAGENGAAPRSPDLELIAVDEASAACRLPTNGFESAPFAVPADALQSLDLATLFDLSSQPGYYNPDRKVALLRRQRRGPYDEVLIDFSRADVPLRIVAGGRVLVEGDWNIQATLDGNELTAVGAWDEACWHRDADCDYLELTQSLDGGWRLDRQLLLARKDRFLFVAAALSGPEDGRQSSAETRLILQLPLARGVKPLPAPEHREIRLSSGGGRATAIPLALPEWRVEFARGSFSVDSAALTLAQTTHGNGIFAPLFFDLDPPRGRQPLTWRPLTVAEGLQIVPRDVAAAYRVQVGAAQWLFYRSLAPRGNRTFLGQNYSSEFVCTRFLASGETRDILSIE